MIFKMCMKVTKKHQVVKTVIRNIPVFVMNDFFRFQKSPKMLFHNQTMFQYVIPFISIWMAFIIHKDVPLWINIFTSLPMGGFWPECSFFKFSFYGTPNSFNFFFLLFSSFFSSVFTKHGSASLSFVFLCLLISFFWHLISLIKKPFSMGLIRTERFFHLLRALSFNIEILSLLSNFIITKKGGSYDY